MDNMLAILGVLGVTLVVTVIAAVLTSGRVRKHGVFGAVKHELGAGMKHRDPYND